MKSCLRNKRSCSKESRDGAKHLKAVNGMQRGRGLQVSEVGCGGWA